MKISLEFDLEKIAMSFCNALKANPETVVALLKNPAFRKRLAEDMLAIWADTNEAEPALIADAYAEYFVPPSSTKQ